MLARRFLGCVLFLTLLAVAAGFALFQFGGDVLLRQATPKGHFQAPPPSDGPDYSADASWLARPTLPTDDAAFVPAGASNAAVGAAAVIFYIHPTTYLDRDRWNAPLAGHRESENRARLFVQSQASALRASGPVWAPRYRQAAFGAFLLDSKDARGALDLAYRDVLAAFDRFLAEAPAAAPILLAGHSQGALHVMRLLKDRVAGQPLQRRVAAAYVVGWPLSVTADLPALGMPACSAPIQAGCLLSWLSFSAPANPDLVVDAYQGSAGLAGGKRRRRDILCVNPLTGTRGGAALPSANPGTLVPGNQLKSATLAIGRVGARCDDGLLMIEGAIPPMGPYVLPGNNYHVYDFALFWSAIRQDAARRVVAWRP